MYDSQNLSLSPKKVIKKSLARLWPSLVVLAIIAGSLWFTFSVIGTIQRQATTVLGGLDATSTVMSSFASTTFSPFRTLPFAALFFFALYLIVVLIYEYYYYKLYYYRFDESAAEIRKGVISRATGHIRYDRLQNIYVDQDWLDRLFGLYDIHYETAGQASGFYSHVDGLPKDRADKLVAFLNEHAGRPAGPVAPPVSAAPTLTSPPAVNGPTEISSREYPISPLHIWLSAISLTFMFSFMSLFFLSIFAIIGLPIIAPIIFVLSYWYASVWYRNFSFRFGPERGEIFTKVIGQSSSFFAYDRIQNVNMSQGLIGRLFHLWLVSIETAGQTSGQRFVIPSLPETSATAIRDFLLAKAGQQQAQL